MSILRWLGVATFLIAYSVGVHYTNSSPRHAELGAILAVFPAVILAVLLALRSTHPVAWLVPVALGGAGLWLLRKGIADHYGLIYWVQHAGMQVLLCITFARTLFAGRQPLCTRFAEALHPPLTEAQKIYSRKVTIAWAVFFACMAVISTLLFAFAPVSIWSFFDNFLVLPLVALMFVVEYWVRRRALPDMEHMHIFDSVRAFRNNLAN
ncbi:hypothetical protein ACFL00_00630 [Pseudomonadota bacterium]